MPLTHFDIEKREPYLGGQPFAETGPYELIDGVAHFAVDPAAEANAPIIDIGNAPRDDVGRVTFESRVMIVTPAAQAEDERRVLLDVPNRGRRLASAFNRVPRDEAVANPLAPGDGFLYRHGFTTLTVGWQWGLEPGEGFWLNAPIATERGETLTGDVVSRLQPARDTNTLPIGQLGKACYPPADPDAPGARLYHQRDPNAPLEEIPRDEWRFAREKDDRVEPSSGHIFRRQGFEAGRHYVLVYQAANPRVAGVGLLAVRDAAIALRHGALLDERRFPIIHAYGASQTGRFLRHFLYLGLNQGEDGSRALDGVMAHIAGGQRLDINARFVQPSSPAVPIAPDSWLVQYTDPPETATRAGALAPVTKLRFTCDTVAPSRAARAIVSDPEFAQ